jgi:hypothetical protein
MPIVTRNFHKNQEGTMSKILKIQKTVEILLWQKLKILFFFPLLFFVATRNTPPQVIVTANFRA